jgi:hypothetical protein
VGEVDKLRTEKDVRMALLSCFAVSLSLSIAVQQTVLALLLAFLFYTCWQTLGVRSSPLDRPLLLFLAALGLATLFSPDVLWSLRAYPRLWMVGAFFATYHLVRTRSEVERLVRLAVFAAAVVAGYGVVQHFTGVDLARELLGKEPNVDPFWLGSREGYRTKALQSSAITYAHNLLFPLSFASALLSNPNSRWRERVALAGAWSLMALALAFSLTRGAWLAATAVLLTIAAIRRGSRGWIAVAGLGLLFLLLVGLGPGVRERAASTFDFTANVGRTQIWRANVEMIQARPLLGWGFGNYKRIRAPYYARYPGADTTAHAHNNFLQISVDSGLVGLAAFVYLFWLVLKRGARTYGLLPAVAEPLKSVVLGGVLAVVGFLVGGMTQCNFIDAEVAIALWFTVGVTMRAGQLAGGWETTAGQTRADAAGS